MLGTGDGRVARVRGHLRGTVIPTGPFGRHVDYTERALGQPAMRSRSVLVGQLWSLSSSQDLLLHT